MRNTGIGYLLAFFIVAATLFSASIILGGCTVDADSLRAVPAAPYRGPAGVDAGAPDSIAALDTTPKFDATSGSDIGVALEVDTHPPAPDVQAQKLDVQPLPDAQPIGLEVQASGLEVQAARDVLPVLDSTPECPHIPWERISPAETTWQIKVDAPANAFCFTVCKTPTFLWLTQLPSRPVRVNGVATLTNPDVDMGFLPPVSAVDGVWIFQVSAGDPGSMQIYGHPSNTTGACP